MTLYRRRSYREGGIALSPPVLRRIFAQHQAQDVEESVKE